MELRMTKFEKRAMEQEFRSIGVPCRLRGKITYIAGQHFQAALDRRSVGFWRRLWAKVRPCK